MSIVAGGNEFVDALKLLGNQEAFQTRLAQLQEAEKRANDSIALVGPASEILMLREQAQREVEELRTMRSGATAEAAAIVADAKKRAETLTQEASALVDQQRAYGEEAKRKANELVTAAQARMQEVMDKERAAQQLHMEASDAFTRAAALADEARAAKAAYEGRKAEIDAAVTVLLKAIAG